MIGLAFAVVGASTVTCGNSSNPARACVPGASVACAGQGGCQGFQVCNSAGSALDQCDCARAAGEDGSVAGCVVSCSGGGGGPFSTSSSGTSGPSCSNDWNAMDCTTSCNGHAYSLSCPGSECAGGFDRDAGCCTVPAVTCSCATDDVETHSWSADPELVNVDSAWAGCAYPGTFEAASSGSSSSGGPLGGVIGCGVGPACVPPEECCTGICIAPCAPPASCCYGSCSACCDGAGLPSICYPASSSSGADAAGSSSGSDSGDSSGSGEAGDATNGTGG